MNYNKYLEQYKSQLIFTVVVLCGVTIVFLVIIPQFQAIMGVRQDIRDVQTKLTTTQKSVQTISGQNKEAINSNFELVTTALPPDKNITNIYTALVGTAAESGVTFDGFTVQLGDVYSKKNITEPVTATTGSPSISVSARFGNVSQETFAGFAQALAEAFPLSEITRVSIVGASGEIRINFFYKPYNLAIIGKQDAVPGVSVQQKELLSKLARWQSQLP